MKTMKRCRFGILPLLWLLGGTLHAQSEFELFSGIYNPGGDFDNGGVVGIRGGQTFFRFVAAELAYTFVNNIQEETHGFEGNAHLISGNALVQIPVDRLVPFATLGVGGLFGKGEGFLRIRNDFAWNAGAGLKVRNLLGPLGLRIDLRFYRISDTFELPAADPRKIDFDFSEFSVGLLLTL